MSDQTPLDDLADRMRDLVELAKKLGLEPEPCGVRFCPKSKGHQ